MKMLVKMIKGWKINWGAPANWDVNNGPCGGLPARLEERQGMTGWVSAWEPTPEELKALNEGGTIHLFINAHPHPVVAMHVEPLVEDHDG